MGHDGAAACAEQLPSRDVRFPVARGPTVMSGDAGAARQLLVDAGVDAVHRGPESELKALQVAEEQFAEAVQDVKDALVSRWAHGLVRNKRISQAEINRRRRWSGGGRCLLAHRHIHPLNQWIGWHASVFRTFSPKFLAVLGQGRG